MPAQRIFSTDNGRKFNVKLNPGYCFAMSIDLAKCILKYPNKIPYADMLTPGKWDIVQSAYMINNQIKEIEVIEAQGLDAGHTISNDVATWDDVSTSCTNNIGANIFSLVKTGAGAWGHAMMWYRDDSTSYYFFLDPNDGCYKFDTVPEAQAWLADMLTNGPYRDADRWGNINVTLS